MKTIYIIRDGYSSNNATINRLMAFVKGFSEIGVNTTVVFIRPNDFFEKVPFYVNNVRFRYLWDGKKIKKNKYIQYFQQIFWILQYLKGLKRGDNIILFGTSEYFLVFTWLKKINFYHEITEHPDNSRVTSNPIWNIYHYIYLKRCQKLKGLFVISQPLKEYFINIGVPKYKVHVVNMIVDSSRFENLKKEISSNKYIAYCGSIVNKKDGVDILIKAYSIVVKKKPDLKLYIAGGFPNKNDEIINRNLVKEYGLQDKVIFLGEISSNDMPQFLKNSEALVLARPDNLQAKHGFPTKLGEYLLTANPVVITKVGDIPNFLKDGESAFIAEPDNVNDFAKKLCNAVSYLAEASIVGASGSEVAKRHFNYKVETEKICNVIFSKQ